VPNNRAVFKYWSDDGGIPMGKSVSRKLSRELLCDLLANWIAQWNLSTVVTLSYGGLARGLILIP